jgi:predicted mannosyl-3-phosphoglycerate phosphatase (HAD superfamily)
MAVRRRSVYYFGMPPARPSVVIFACIDDVRSWFKCEAAQRAIHRLASRDVPVVFVSTGPAQDILVAQQSVGLRQPFICGGGALLYVPAEYFGDLGTVGVRRDTWRVVEFDVCHDPGPAIGLLLSLYRMRNEHVVVVGLGRERADAVLLQQVEVPIVVRHDSIDQTPLIRALPSAYWTSAEALDGWLEAVFGSSGE